MVIPIQAINKAREATKLLRRTCDSNSPLLVAPTLAKEALRRLVSILGLRLLLLPLPDIPPDFILVVMDQHQP
jgi:Cft2 family RNA processing exonuclease